MRNLEHTHASACVVLALPAIVVAAATLIVLNMVIIVAGTATIVVTTAIIVSTSMTTANGAARTKNASITPYRGHANVCSADTIVATRATNLVILASPAR